MARSFLTNHVAYLGQVTQNQLAISELSLASVSKRVFVQNVELDLHGKEPVD